MLRVRENKPRQKHQSRDCDRVFLSVLSGKTLTTKTLKRKLDLNMRKGDVCFPQMKLFERRKHQEAEKYWGGGLYKGKQLFHQRVLLWRIRGMFYLTVRMESKV